MAKKTQRSAAGKKDQALLNQEPAEEIQIPLSESSSDEEETEFAGFEEQPTKTETKSGHTVNLNKDEESETTTSKSKRGVIYIGRLPNQFKEPEMKKYFSQFGNVTRYRLSRNKTTGASKHYGFLEFENHESAKIAAETMHNYLLLGHLLQVSVMDKPHKDLFPAKLKSKFIEFDYRKKQYAEFNKRKSLEEWQALQTAYETEKASHLAELKELGFNYSLEA